MRSSGRNAKNRLRRSSVVPPSAIDLFWDLLVAYANADPHVPRRWEKFTWTKLVPAHNSPFDRIAHFLFASGLVFGFPQIPAEFDPDEPGIPEDCTDHIFRTTSKQLKHHHEMFKSTLTWICSPSIDWIPDIREMSRLWRAKNPDAPAGPVVLTAGRYPMISEEDERIVAYLEKHAVLSVRRQLYLDDRILIVHPDRWKVAIDPFCAFLLEQSLGKPLSELPVKLCARRTCGRFFLPAKNTGKFCSDSCRARNFWTPVKRSEYMREYRQRNFPLGVQKKKMKEKSAGRPIAKS
jgi:hypothetical protein